MAENKQKTTKHTVIDFKATFEKLGKAFGTSVRTSIVSASKTLKNDITDAFKKGTSGFFSSFRSMFSNAIDELDTVINSSRLSNRQTRETALRYGFSASETYGWNKSMGLLGFQSEEDLLYASKEEMTMFRTLFQEYSNKYNKLYDSGMFRDMLAYEIEMKKLKDELSLNIVQFMINNKGLILDFMNVSMWAAKGIMNIISKIASFVGVKVDNEYTSGLLASSTTNNSQEIKVTISNNYNNVSSSDKDFIEQGNALTVQDLISVAKQFGGYTA